MSTAVIVVSQVVSLVFKYILTLFYEIYAFIKNCIYRDCLCKSLSSRTLCLNKTNVVVYRSNPTLTLGLFFYKFGHRGWSLIETAPQVEADFLMMVRATR
jgi:hypothetical protein